MIDEIKEMRSIALGRHTLLILEKDGSGYLSTGDDFYDEELSVSQVDELTRFLNEVSEWRAIEDEPPTPQDP